ncbi:ATPase inhibitor subunit zeta, partial [Brucella melitensis]
DAEAEAYAREVVAADFEEAGDEDVFRKVRADLDAAGVSTTDEAIREKMFAFMEEAIRQVKQD